MGWLRQANGKPRIFHYNGTSYSDPNPQWFTWMTGNLWAQYEECACFENDMGRPIIVNHCKIGICACDSGGRGYWVWGSYRGIPAKGYGATYTMYTRVENPGSTSFEESSRSSLDIPSIGSAASQRYDQYGKLLAVKSNMNTPGTGPRNTARFGYPPYGEGNNSIYTGTAYKDFAINNCPIVMPGGKLYLHLKVHDFKGPKDNVTVRFLLDPDQMEVNIEPARSPYIWVRMPDKKWHLKEPLYVKKDDGTWTPTK